MKWLIITACTVTAAALIWRSQVNTTDSPSPDSTEPTERTDLTDLAEPADLPSLADSAPSWLPSVSSWQFTPAEVPDQLPSTVEAIMQTTTQAASNFKQAITGTAPSVGAVQGNRRAFLDMIAYAEGTSGPNGYRTLFGGGLFEGFTDHPRQAKQFSDKAGRTLWTSAAGRYQFMAASPIPTGGATKVNTWDVLAKQLGLSDFGPDNQDRAALELVRQRGALADVDNGRIAQAIDKVRTVWASLPGAGYAQHERKLPVLLAQYAAAGGNIEA